MYCTVYHYIFRHSAIKLILHLCMSDSKHAALPAPALHKQQIHTRLWIFRLRIPVFSAPNHKSLPLLLAVFILGITVALNIVLFQLSVDGCAGKNVFS